MKFAFLSVPWLLIPKPLFLYIQNAMSKKKSDEHLPLAGDEGGDAPAAAASSGHGHGHGGEFAFDEILIHQIIETIEYVLGTVSHTASYLRMWALSLAHQQLSVVFFQKTLQTALEMPYPSNCLGIFVGFTCWFVVTLGVLLGMDVLECFLHTLRLHWVEFQSKFFRADGHLFEPYRHQKLLTLEQ